jgi:hypothetical protein
MSKTMNLLIELECDNSDCRETMTQVVNDFCGDSSWIFDVEDVEWKENSDKEVFCSDCVALAERITG